MQWRRADTGSGRDASSSWTTRTLHGALKSVDPTYIVLSGALGINRSQESSAPPFSAQGARNSSIVAGSCFCCGLRPAIACALAIIASGLIVLSGTGRARLARCFTPIIYLSVYVYPGALWPTVLKSTDIIRCCLILRNATKFSERTLQLSSVSNQIIFDALQALRKKNDTESMYEPGLQAVPLACRSDLPSKSGQRIQVKSVVHFSASGCDVAAHQVQDPQPEAPAPLSLYCEQVAFFGLQS